MKIITINLKENSPSVDIAIANMNIEIERYSTSDFKILKFIHGYGSSGKGGAIFFAVRQELQKLKKSGKIKDYIVGEHYNIQNGNTLKLLFDYGLEQDNDLYIYNPGMTIVILR